MYSHSLKSAINRYLDVGHKTLTKGEIARSASDDLPLAVISLQFWQAKGWLTIIADPISSDNSEVCVNLKSYIDDDAPWSDPMSGKM